MDKTLIYGIFLKLLWYRLSQLSTNILNYLFNFNFFGKKIEKKTSKFQWPDEKMCLSRVYY
jgi:hypothetical protein